MDNDIYMYIYMYVYICIYIYVYIYVCVYVCIYICVCLHSTAIRKAEPPISETHLLSDGSHCS